MKSFQYFFFYFTFQPNRIVLLIHSRENFHTKIQDLYKDFISQTNFPKEIKFLLRKKNSNSNLVRLKMSRHSGSWIELGNRAGSVESHGKSLNLNAPLSIRIP